MINTMALRVRKAALLMLGAMLAACGRSDDALFGTGSIGDAKCDVAGVQEANSDHLHAILDDLSHSTFFRLFRVTLDRTCPFWTQEKLPPASCGSEAAPSNGIGAVKSAPFGAAKPAAPFSISKPKTACSLTPPSDEVDHSNTAKEEKAQSNFGNPDCSDAELPTFWMDMCSKFSTNTTSYVNLVKNPETFTGYNGSHVWEAIYRENCFAMEVPRRPFSNDMCYEERVLYRILSGLHTATSIEIFLNYHAPGVKGRTKWEPNPELFYDVFSGHPDRLKNLLFAYVVLLRSVAKATPYLYHYPYTTGNATEDAHTQLLMRHLLDSRVLRTCSPVFTAFDESLLFSDQSQTGKPSSATTLKRQFKAVFHNISSLLDCVTCQKCKLHAKLKLQGLGTALKVLLLPENLISASVSREEIVALVNTLGRFSHALEGVDRLTSLYKKNRDANLAAVDAAAAITDSSTPRSSQTPLTAAAKSIHTEFSPFYGTDTLLDTAKVQEEDKNVSPPAPQYKTSSYQTGPLVDLIDVAIGLVSQLMQSGALDAAAKASGLPSAAACEEKILSEILRHNAHILLLAKHYASNPSTFLRHVMTFVVSRSGLSVSPMATKGSDMVDAVVVGGGLAGLSATLALLDRGARRVILVDKAAHLGGNSAKASSGINSVFDAPDSIEAFTSDTVKSAGKHSPLTDVMVAHSRDALNWLVSRVNVNLNDVAQLGGHTHARTRRPQTAMVGAEVTFALIKELKKFASGPDAPLQIWTRTRMTNLMTDVSGAVLGIEFENGDGASGSLQASSTIVTTGGFGYDRFSNTSLMQLHRPDLAHYPTTTGEWTTGDGVKTVLAADIGAYVVDMDKIQLHPTGFVDPKDPNASTKVLCAELMRGAGGLLVDGVGNRFCDELGTRAYVVGRMLNHSVKEERSTFYIVLGDQVASSIKRHVALYSHKGLLQEYSNVSALAAGLNMNESSLQSTLMRYNQHSSSQTPDAFGKTLYKNTPVHAERPFYVGQVVPVIHYTMGGLVIDTETRVLRKGGGHIPGLYAAGEVSGGLHGNNRLAGNSLLECLVFGLIAGRHAPLVHEEVPTSLPVQQEIILKGNASATSSQAQKNPAPLRSISADELAKHNTATDLWVSLYGRVYDLTSYAEHHPGGSQAILDVGGSDGTAVFEAVHNEGMLEEFVDMLKGHLK